MRVAAEPGCLVREGKIRHYDYSKKVMSTAANPLHETTEMETVKN
jgi:hypothetical protein